jgi:hypothetical protein
MPYVPGFDYDLFISYASDDNRDGVVSEFVAEIKEYVSDNLVNCFAPQEKIRIYFDRERLASQIAVNWEEHLRAAASSSAILVSPVALPQLFELIILQPGTRVVCRAIACWRCVPLRNRGLATNRSNQAAESIRDCATASRRRFVDRLGGSG